MRLSLENVRRTIDDLTARREREIGLLAAQGLASKEIGERLFISRRTAENHLAKVYDKVGVRTRAELARVFDGGFTALAS